MRSSVFMTALMHNQRELTELEHYSHEWEKNVRTPTKKNITKRSETSH